MYLMLQQDLADDYVIATGESRKLEEFVAEAFSCNGLDWQDHVMTDSSLLRPTDLAISRGDPNKAKVQLGWQAQYKMAGIVQMMVEAKQKEILSTTTRY
jgi:GDPmannose 4,6-dehydratase